MLPAPPAINVPTSLPDGLLPDLLRRRKLLLFLDYDGTISEITPDFANAKPLPAARPLIARLAAHPDRLRIAIVSGRDIDDLHRLLGLDRNLLFVGAHGLQVMELDGQRWLVSDMSRCMPELSKVRDWLHSEIDGKAGFSIEDKGLSIALHYRLADPSEASVMRRRLEHFVEHQTSHLRLGGSKMVVEAMPRNASKGFAVRFIIERAGAEFVPVYLGDDITDEDAFFALRNDGVTIVVAGEPGPSWAKYRIANPRDVIELLADLDAALDAATPTTG